MAKLRRAEQWNHSIESYRRSPQAPPKIILSSLISRFDQVGEYCHAAEIVPVNPVTELVSNTINLLNR